MSRYIVSFNLEYGDDGKRYSRVYDALMETIATYKPVWTETTSFAVFESDDSLVTVRRNLWYGADMDKSKDSLLVIQDTYPMGEFSGKGYGNLGAIAPGIKKV